MTKLRVIVKIWRGAFRLGKQMTTAILRETENSLRSHKSLMGCITIKME